MLVFSLVVLKTLKSSHWRVSELLTRRISTARENGSSIGVTWKIYFLYVIYIHVKSCQFNMEFSGFKREYLGRYKLVFRVLYIREFV